MTTVPETSTPSGAAKYGTRRTTWQSPLSWRQNQVQATRQATRALESGTFFAKETQSRRVGATQGGPGIGEIKAEAAR